ncbi:VCBS repeat-containing protein [Vibrio crassostreae]|uniref:VCBS domain-containing protein n=21 Tax=Vibrio crassostreae TaxID=246167 RepID=UPI0010DD941C|nr:VCBS domain-containing protein [Vibrio crassostreae]TCT72773.1 VCBS repeat-containing protein [Vibrio crassostreae]
MTKENNVKKSTKLNKKEQPKTQSANAVKQKKPKKVRLHSKLKVNVPLTQSLMLILPSLAKHASAETMTPTDDATLAHQDSTNNQESAVHQSTDISKDKNQKPITRNIHDSDAIVGQESASTGGETTLRPSHHLSSSSHPQAHYIPASSIPSIESGGITAPTNNVPTTPSLPVTFTPEVIKGIYGELHVDAGGKYTFVLNPLSPQYVLLHQNQPGTDKFVLHLSNGSSVVVQIPVTGKQDVPTISGDLHGIVTEDNNVDSHGLLNATGKIDVIDPDHDQSSVLAETITGKYGSLTIDSNGHWQYQVDNSLSNVQALTTVTSLQESFTIHTKDGTPQALEMTIGGIDDNAVVTGLDTGTLIEDSTLHAHGQLTVSDPDLNQDHFQSEQLQGHLGTLSIQPDGSWTYDLDNQNPTVQALGQGSTATDTITVHSADGTPHQITIAVNGTNDKAVISTNTAGSPHSYLMAKVSTNDGQVTEETNLIASGVLNVTDVDANQAHFSNTDIKGALGTLHLTVNGIWIYTLDNNNPTVQALGKHHSATDTVTIHSADGTPHQVTILVNGTNDGALISGTNTGKVTEETMLTTSGQLKITDVDTGEAHFSNTDIAGSLGTLHLTGSGSWTYDLDNTNPTVQALGKGATATDTITVHSADGTAHQVTITVNGTNDAAVIGGTNTGAVTEESQLHTSGTLTVTDVDTGEAHFSNTDIAGSLGTLHLTDSGSWTYDLDNTNPTVQALGKGATATDTITVHSADGTAHQVTITVNGTNDAAVIGGTNTGAVTEESQLHTSGTLTVTDVDTGEAHFSNIDIAGSFGTLHLTDTGSWTYDLDNTNPTVQALGKGSTATDTITVHSADGTPHQVTITVNGTNDAAIIGGTNSGTVTEESQFKVSGTLTVTDVDTGEAHFSNTDIAGNLGTLHLTESGSWTYDLDNTNPKVQALSAGQQTTEVINVTSADGTQKQVTVTINGADDQSTITGTSTGTVTEDQYVQANGKLVAHDVDAQDHTDFVAQQNAQGQYGTFNLSPDGSWDYLLTSQKLTSADTVTEHFMVHTSDGTQQEIVVTVKGHDDQAHITGFTTGVVTEDGQSTVSDQLYVADQDAQQDHFTAQMDTPTQYGHFSITEAGLWTFTLDNTNPTVQALGKGVTATDTITVHSADGTPHQVTITVNGTNDVAIIGGTNSGAVTEESKLQTSGTLTVTDVDTGEAHFSNTDIVGSLGTLHLTDSGSWTYDLDNTNPTVQALGKGATATDTITVHSADGTPHQVIITVNGTNDAAVISGDTVKSIHENALFDADKHDVTTRQNAHSLSGALTSQDVDSGQSNLFQPIHSQMGHYGSISLDANGHWHYQLAPSEGKTIDVLAQGEHVTEVFTVKAIDGTSQTISIEIMGDNDSASITLQPSRSHTTVFEDKISDIDTSGALRAYGNVDVTDVDNQGSTTHSEELLKSETAHTAIGGVFTVHGTSWDYQVDPNNSKVQALAAGEKLVETHTITSIDGTASKQVSVTIVGTNDAAVITGTDTGDVTEGNAGQDMSPDYAQPGMAFLGRSTIHTTGKLNITDVDTGEAEFDTHGIGFTYSGQYGDLLLNKDGSWSYHADTGQIRSTGGLTSTRGTTIDQLGENQTLTDTVTVFTKDGTSHDIVITIHGSNDRPYCASEVQLNSGKEDLAQTITSTELLANTVDVDANDAGQLSITNLHADHGSIRDNNDGTFTFTPNSDYNGKIQFSYDVKDAHGGVTSTSASLDLAPVDDAAVITGQHAGDITEDNLQSYQSALTVKGHLHVVDPDGGEAQFTSVTKIDDPYNTTQNGLSISPNGAWSYDVNNNLSSVQNMAEGETKDIVYEVQTVDGTKQRITITLHGTNDSPILQFTSYGNASAGSNPISTDEDKAITISIDRFVGAGKDIDHGDTLHIEQLQVDHGKAVLSADGQSVIYTPEKDFNGHATFTYQIADSHGALAINPATGHPGLSGMMIDVNAMPDNAVIGGDITGGVTEDKMMGMALLQAHGTLTITDPDAGEAQFLPNDGVHNNGYETAMGGLVTINPKTGDWSYVVDNFKTEVQSLGATETAVDTVTIHSKDGTAQQIQITIHGVNDNPTVSSVVTLASGTEDTDQTIQASDLLALATDVDKNDAGQLTLGAISVDHGSITDNHDGTYTLHQEANYNGQVSLTYDIKDAHGGSVATSASLNLAPVRDAALISGTDTGSIVEDKHVGPSSAQTIAVSGSLSIIDPDTGENHFQFSQLGEKAIHDPFGGDLRITPAGNWGYAVTNSRLQSLSAGEVETVVYRVYSADYTSHDITITVTGTNDDPVLTAQSQSVTEGGTALTGQMSATDVDTKDTHSYSIAKPVDGLTLNSDGSYRFDPKHSAYQHLGAHDQQVLTIPVTVDDHHGGTDTKNLTITVQGSNDGAIITGQHAGDITEDKQASYSTELTLQGSLHVVDPDGGEAEFTTVTKIDDPYNTHHNGLTISKSGSWHYIVENNLVQNMAEGETKDIVYEVQTVDGTKQRITITLHGTNDNPTLIFAGYGNLSTGSHPITTDEDKAVTIPIDRFVVFGKDVDHGDTLHIEQLHVDRGTAVLSKDGQSVIYTPEKDFNGHATFTYQVLDSHGALAINPSTGHPGLSGLMLDVHAMPDNAVIGGIDTGSVTEDSFSGMQWLIAKGQLTISDADAGEDKFDPMVHAQNNAGIGYDTKLGGHVLLSQDGSWQYNMDNFSTAVQKLAEGETAVDTVTIHSVDGTPHDIQITIHGTNDDPILSVTQTTPTTGTLTETDVDVKDTHSFSVVSPTGQFGDLSVDPTSGAYVYTPNSSVSGMSYNSATHTYHGADVFEVKVADNHGGESSRFLTFDTNGQVNLITGQHPTITTTVPQNPIVTTAQPSLPTSSNTPPSNAVTVDLVASSDSGKSDTDNLTNDNTPTITGHTDIPYSQVTVYDGSTPIGHAVSDGSGQYSAVVTNLTDGDHNLSAKALAPSSVLPATSSLLSVHVDTTIAPLTIALTHDTGNSASDLITNDGALTISGQEAGAIVEYSTDNGQTWTSSFTSQQGSNTVSVRQTDTAGNVSTNTSLSFTLDNSIAAPTVSLVQDTGRHLINTPDLITQDSQLSIQTEAGAKIEYSNDGGHSWTAIFNPVEGVNNLQVRQTDIAGNVSPATHFSFTLDTTPGTVTVNPISQDNALNAAENNQPLVITGTTSNVDPGDVVYVIVGNNHFYDATVKSDGSWSLTLSASAHQSILAADHDYPIQVGSVDAAGNSTPRISTHLLVDTQNPIPHIAVDSVTQDNVLNALESGQSIPITGTVTGDYHTGDTVSLKINGANIPSLTGTVDAAGHFSIPVAGNVLERANIHTSYASGQAAPIHSIEATIQTTDAVGNTGSATTGSQVFTVDTQIHIGIHTDPVTVDNVINDQESYSSVDITGSVSGDFNTGDVVTLNVNGIKHTGAVDSHGHYSIAVPGSELIADADQKIEASIAVTDSAGNSAHATTDVVYQVDTQVSLPTITFESAGADNLYSKAEIARGDANTITATITPPGDAKIGEHLVVNGQDHVLDAHSLQNGLQIEVAPGSHVQVTMTDEHGNTAGSQGFAASAIPDPIIVKAPPGSHQVSGSLGTPPLLPSLTPVPTAQHGWRIHLPDGSYVTSHHGQYGTLTIDPQTGDLHYQEQANVHTGPHGSASGIGQHEDKFEVALQGTNQDEVVAHVNVQILSHGPGNSGKLNIGTEVVDMTITPITHTSHPAPPPPPPVLHDEPDMSSQADFTVTQSDDSYLDLTQHAHQAPDQKTSHHGAAAYLDALGIKPDATSTTVDDQPADMDIVLAQVDQPDAATHDQAHLDMSDALEHHDANINHNQDDEHHHHNDVDGLPDIDPNP